MCILLDECLPLSSRDARELAADIQAHRPAVGGSKAPSQSRRAAWEGNILTAREVQGLHRAMLDDFAALLAGKWAERQ